MHPLQLAAVPTARFKGNCSAQSRSTVCDPLVTALPLQRCPVVVTHTQYGSNIFEHCWSWIMGVLVLAPESTDRHTAGHKQ